MKLLFCIIVSAFVAGVGLAQEEREARPRFKGVELYSWKGSKGDWVFALLSGTNRLKTAEEVKAPKNQIAGLAELKKAFERLAMNETVSWSHLIDGFEYPPEGTTKRIEKLAQATKIALRRAESKK